LVADLGVPRWDSFAREHSEVVESALEVADPADTANYARLLALLSESLTFTPDAERRVALAHRALRLAEQSDDPTIVASVAPAVLAALWAPGNDHLRGEVAARALLGAEASGDPLLQFSVNLAARQVAVESGDPAMAAHNLTRLRATAQSVAEPHLRWLILLLEVFEATMAGELSDAEALAAAALELGLQIGAPNAFAMYAAEFFVLRTFAGRHGELFPLVEQSTRENPTVLPFKLAYGIICAAVGQPDAAREILHEGMESRFAGLAVDNLWMTSVIAYAIIAIELDDRDAAVQLLPMIEPHAAQISFNGVTSQGPVGSYAGKLASLLGQHEEAEDHLRTALATATAFGWTYHRATTLFAWPPPGHPPRRAPDLRLTCGGDARMTRARLRMTSTPWANGSPDWQKRAGAMTTLVIVHEVDDVEHWRTSTRREEYFGPLGITARTFIDPDKSNRVGLVVECPSLAAFQEALQGEPAAEAMKFDGVRPETLKMFVEG
jgi:hypothetical protein